MTEAAPVAGATRRDGAGRRARLLAWLTAVGGLVALLGLLPGVGVRISALDDVVLSTDVRVFGSVVTLLAGLLLLFLAAQVGRRKRAAWLVCVALFGVTALSHLVKGPSPLATAYSVLVVGLFLAWRRDFTARADPPSLFALVRFVPLYFAVVLVYGAVALVLERDRIEPDLTAGGIVDTVFAGLVGLDGPYTYEGRFFSKLFPASLLALGIVGLVVVVVLLFRPLVDRHPHTPEDWARAERLVRRYGWDTLNYFALRDDKSFFFGSDGEAMLAFAYLGGYGLVSGDPIGAPGSIPRLLDEYMTFCRERGWRPAFLSVRERDQELYAERGLRTFYLGDEAIIHCRDFKLEGKKMKGVRQAVNRVGRRYRFELLRESEASPELVDALNAISRRWRGKAPERGFTMALSQDVKGHDPEFLLSVALDEHDRPGGFLRVVPAFGDDPGYTLDLMRHDPDSPNGMTEFLIANSARALGERGFDRLSMNFAAWGRLFNADVPLTPIQRIEKKAIALLNPFFQIQSLHDFNAKFFPEWLPRALVYEHPQDLPRVGILYVGAEGFLALPVVGQLLVPRAVGGVPSPVDT